MRAPLAATVTALLTCAAATGLSVVSTAATQSNDEINVLIVTAHPDDDAMFSGSVYKITHTLGGNVDLALITDGSGGYRYSQLAEPIYGLKLTDEAVARQHLPAIRKQELMAGGAIVGIRNYFFLDQYDHQYTENIDSVMNHVWDVGAVRARLNHIMTRVSYDYVFVHLPIPNFHAHHKSATILALETARDLPGPSRPVVLGAFVGTKADTTQFDFTEHQGYPITRVRTDTPPFVFDLTQPLSPDGRMDYRIVVNWVIAEHKSQGAMQLLVNSVDIERFWFFESNDPAEFERTKALFKRLSEPVVFVEGRP